MYMNLNLQRSLVVNIIVNDNRQPKNIVVEFISISTIV